MLAPMSALTPATARLGVTATKDPPVFEQVEKVINAIRPAIQADEGDIELIGVDEATGVVSVELKGACVTCPASTQTLKAGINGLMKVVPAHFGAAADMLQTWACRFGSDDDIVASASCF